MCIRDRHPRCGYLFDGTDRVAGGAGSFFLATTSSWAEQQVTLFGFVMGALLWTDPTADDASDQQSVAIDLTTISYARRYGYRRMVSAFW